MSCDKVARGLLLYGQQIADGALDRHRFLREIDVRNTAFRSAGHDLGATSRVQGVRFFDSSRRNWIAFGPGAGVVIGVSVGSAGIRAALVDANGWLYHPYESELLLGQLSLPPEDLLERIRVAVAKVLDAALGDERLLVDGALPFLGVATAWSVPVGRDGRPLGPALRDPAWQFGAPLDQRVAQHLNLPRERSHALNDGHANAIAVAWGQTRAEEHLQQITPRLAIVLRLGGSISGATIVVEPPELSVIAGKTSGFPHSVLIGGANWQAGAVGHVPLEWALIGARNEGRPAGLGELTAAGCSCTELGAPVPPHLEAYASTAALVRRVAPTEPESDVVRRVVAEPDSPVHRRALRDVGALVGHALLGSVAMLDPATITLTGPLAVPTVQAVVAERLAAAQPFGVNPEVRLLRPEVDRFVEVQGAALGIIRAHVHRRIESLVGGPQESAGRIVRAHTAPLTRYPWDSVASVDQPLVAITPR